MADNLKPEVIDTYLDDLKVIKSLLIKVENTPLFERWVFTTWGIFTLLGTALHGLLYAVFQISNHTLSLRVWLPIMLAGGILESIGWGRALTRASLSLSSPRVYKFYLNFFCTAGALIFIGFLMIRLGGYSYLCNLILVGFAIIFFNFSVVGAYEHLFVYALVFLIIGVVLFLIMPPFIIQILFTGGSIGLAMLLVGLTQARKATV